MDNQIEEILKNEELAVAVCEAATPEAIKSIMSEHGIEMDDEACAACFDKIKSVLNDDELSEDSLEEVSGGIFGLCAAATIAGWAIVGAVGGVVVAGCLLYAYALYKKSQKKK